jgi:hypothetical protein
MTNPDVTMKEKKEILDNDRKVRAGTYKSLAEAEFQNEYGGRYAAAITKTKVAGSDPSVSYPKQPSSSFWSRDPIGLEPSLGYRIDDQEPVGEKFEIERSLSSAVKAAPETGDAAVDGPAPEDPSQMSRPVTSKRWRRL